MNRKSFQVFVEKFEDIEENKYSRILAKAISLLVLHDIDYENNNDYQRLIYIKDNTNAYVRVPLHKLDAYVNPSDEVINSQLGIQQEFPQNEGGTIMLNGFDIECFLFDAYVEIQIIISRVIRGYNFVTRDSMKGFDRGSLPYPNLLNNSGGV